jgi:hypothetical protein
MRALLLSITAGASVEDVIDSYASIGLRHDLSVAFYGWATDDSLARVTQMQVRPLCCCVSMTVDSLVCADVHGELQRAGADVDAHIAIHRGRPDVAGKHRQLGVAQRPSQRRESELAPLHTR